MSLFDAKAHAWEKPERIARTQKITRQISAHVPFTKHTHVLEYGAGTALFSRMVARECCDVWAVDESAMMLHVGEVQAKRERIENITFMNADFSTSSPIDRRFDVIVSVLTLHHIEDIGSLMKTLRVMCKPSAHIAIIDLEAEDGSFHQADEHIPHAGFSKKEIQTPMFEAGFTPTQYERIATLEKQSNTGEKRSYPLFISIGRAF